MASGGSSGGSSGAGSHSEPQLTPSGYDPEHENDALSSYLFIICGAVSVAVIVWKLCDKIIKLSRHMACLNNDKQRYFAIPSPNVSSLKRHLLYAPIFSKRHNREIQLSSAVNIGTLPSRFQLSFLAAYFITNVIFCVIEIPYAADVTTAAGQLRNRTGVLATVNMVCFIHLPQRCIPLLIPR